MIRKLFRKHFLLFNLLTSCLAYISSCLQSETSQLDGMITVRKEQMNISELRMAAAVSPSLQRTLAQCVEVLFKQIYMMNQLLVPCKPEGHHF